MMRRIINYPSPPASVNSTSSDSSDSSVATGTILYQQHQIQSQQYAWKIELPGEQLLRPYMIVQPLVGNAQGKSRKISGKRTRTTYSPNQLFALETAFKECNHLCPTEQAILAEKLQLSQKQVSIWFKNRRAKKLRNEDKLSAVSSDLKRTNKNNISSTRQRYQPYPSLLKSEPVVTKYPNNTDATHGPSLKKAVLNQIPPWYYYRIADNPNSHNQHLSLQNYCSQMIKQSDDCSGPTLFSILQPLSHPQIQYQTHEVKESRTEPQQELYQSQEQGQHRDTESSLIADFVKQEIPDVHENDSFFDLSLLKSHQIKYVLDVIEKAYQNHAEELAVPQPLI